MATVSSFVKPCKPVKAYFAHLYEQSGILTKVDGEILFFADETGEITTVEPDMFTFLTVLGQVGLADAQKLADRRIAPMAAVACGRTMGRQ